MKQSAGILLYRKNAHQQTEVFLVHPGGPFWAKKDDGAWSIPKGEYAEGEDPLPAAIREFHEEIGQTVPFGEPKELAPVVYGNKRLIAWAIEGDIDESKIVSNMFTLEWPPRSGRTQEFPEVDKAIWCTAEVARQKLLAGQQPLLDELIALVG